MRHEDVHLKKGYLFQEWVANGLIKHTNKSCCQYPMKQQIQEQAAKEHCLNLMIEAAPAKSATMRPETINTPDPAVPPSQW